MNDLSLFNPNQKATSKEVVTTKQLAETLGVDVRTVQRAAEKTGCDSTVIPLKTAGGVQSTRVFDEEQATLIKQRMNFTFEVIPMEEDRPSLKAFKNYMCNKYAVKNVNDIDMPIKEYADLMKVFEAGYAAKEKEIIDKVIADAEKRIKEIE